MPEGFYHKIVDQTLDDLLERLEVNRGRKLKHWSWAQCRKEHRVPMLQAEWDACLQIWVG